MSGYDVSTVEGELRHAHCLRNRQAAVRALGKIERANTGRQPSRRNAEWFDQDEDDAIELVWIEWEGAE